MIQSCCLVINKSLFITKDLPPHNQLHLSAYLKSDAREKQGEAQAGTTKSRCGAAVQTIESGLTAAAVESNMLPACVGSLLSNVNENLEGCRGRKSFSLIIIILV